MRRWGAAVVLLCWVTATWAGEVRVLKADEENAVMKAINDNRCYHSAASLDWSVEAAKAAVEQAFELSAQGQCTPLKQSPTKPLVTNNGVFMVSTTRVDHQQLTTVEKLTSWVSATLYYPAYIYDFSAEPSQVDDEQARMAQMLWMTTKKVGCAICEDGNLYASCYYEGESNQPDTYMKNLVMRDDTLQCPPGSHGVSPTLQPTPMPRAETPAPSDAPTAVPTLVPMVRTVAPTDAPTDVPTDAPTDVPTDAPTDVPTDAPTDVPKDVSTDVPTDVPTTVPTAVPKSTTDVPTLVPMAGTAVPTDAPTEAPTDAPSTKTTILPSTDTRVPPTPAPTLYSRRNFFALPWISLGFKFHTTWPKSRSWIKKLVTTLLLALKPSRNGTLYAKYVCPLVDGKMMGMSADCQVLDNDRSVLQGRGAEVLAETEDEWLKTHNSDKGVYVEFVITGEDTAVLQEDKTALEDAIVKAQKHEPPLFDKERVKHHDGAQNDFLLIDPMEFSNGELLVKRQKGDGNSEWDPALGTKWVEPEAKEKKVAWWVWTLVGLCACGIATGAGALLVVKSARARANGANVTVSEFYRTMPEGFLGGPIPEEHYCTNPHDDLNSSVELEGIVRTRTLSGFGHIQPVGRI